MRQSESKGNVSLALRESAAPEACAGTGHLVEVPSTVLPSEMMRLGDDRWSVLASARRRTKSKVVERLLARIRC